MTLSTERPSWRTRLHRVLVRIAVGLFVLVCLIYACEYATEWHRRERLAALVQSIKTLQIGVTTDEEVRALSERYGGRFTPEGTFTEPRTSTLLSRLFEPIPAGCGGTPHSSRAQAVDRRCRAGDKGSATGPGIRQVYSDEV